MKIQQAKIELECSNEERKLLEKMIAFTGKSGAQKEIELLLAANENPNSQQSLNILQILGHKLQLENELYLIRHRLLESTRQYRRQYLFTNEITAIIQHPILRIFYFCLANRLSIILATSVLLTLGFSIADVPFYLLISLNHH